MTSFTKSLPAVTLLTGVFYLNFLTRTIMAPLLIHLEQAFSLNHTAATSLLVYQSAGFSVCLFLSGIIAGYLQHRKVVTLSVVGSGIALCVLSFSNSLWLAKIGFTLVGAATGLYLASGIAMLSDVTPKQHWGKAIAIHELAPNLAFVSAPILIETLTRYTDWQGALRTTGVLCLFGGIYFFLSAKGGKFCGIRPTLKTFPELMHRKATWGFAAIATIVSVLESSPYNILPLYLISERDMNSLEANSVISLSRIITPALPLLGGWLSDRFHYRPVIYIGLSISALAMVGVALCNGALLTLSLILQAASPALMFPAIFAALAHAFSPKEQSLVLSLTMPVIAICSTGIFPFFLGVCGDNVGFGTGFFTIAACCVATLFAPRYLSPNYAQPNTELQK